MSVASGATGTGTATGLNGTGDVIIALNGKNYTGKWTKVQSGGVGYASGLAAGATFSGSSIIAGQSTGNALLKAPDGSGLRCQFSWSPLSSAGIGKCQDDAGTSYDLQIH